MALDFHFSFKVAIVGNSGVGKTTLLDGEYTRHSQDRQADNPLLPRGPSVSLSFKAKFYEVENYTYRVQYWDCPGANRFMRLTSRYCAGAAGVIFVFDVNDRKSFTNLDTWIKEVEKYSSVAKVVVGNKVGSDEEREVSKEEAEQFAAARDLVYIETNAISGHGCPSVFQSIFALVLAEIPRPPEPSALLKKGIEIGDKILADKRFAQSLFLASSKSAQQDGAAQQGGGQTNWL